MDKKGKAKIMLVEDDETQAMMYELEFANHGYTVIKATSGKEAIELAQKVKPDLIFIDMLLGDMNGIDLLIYLKANDKTKGCKVVVLSNLQKKELIEQAKKEGAEDFLVKMQFIPKDIVARAEKYLSGK